MNTVNFYLPVNLDLELILKTHFSNWLNDIDKFFYVISKIYVTRFTDNRYRDLTKIQKLSRKHLYIRLHSSILKSILTTKKYKQILTLLEKIKIIESLGNHYQSGSESKSYRLSMRYSNQTYRYVTCKNWQLNQKIIDFNMLEIQNDSLLSSLYDMFVNSFIFDTVGCNNQITSLYQSNAISKEQWISYSLQCTRIQNGDFYLTKSKKVGRIFHNYENLKKEFRTLLKHRSGNNLFELDISNCQPFILATLLKPNHNDVQNYINLATNGNLYNYLATKYQLDKEDLKIKMLILLNGKNYYNFLVKEIFINEFPNVYATINEIKKDNYKELSKILFQGEVNLMINNVCSRLLDEKIDFIPIHDSLMVTEDKLERTKHIIADSSMSLFGMTPTLKLK